MLSFPLSAVISPSSPLRGHQWPDILSTSLTAPPESNGQQLCIFPSDPCPAINFAAHGSYSIKFSLQLRSFPSHMGKRRTTQRWLNWLKGDDDAQQSRQSKCGRIEKLIDSRKRIMPTSTFTILPRNPYYDKKFFSSLPGNRSSNTNRHSTNGKCMH